MPSETKDRYSVPENDINSKRNIFDKFFTQTTLKEKVKFIINNFKKWLDE